MIVLGRNQKVFFGGAEIVTARDVRLNVTGGEIDISCRNVPSGGGWKGVEYTTAVPIGQVVLLALMLLLSHRREVLRIRQNGQRS